MSYLEVPWIHFSYLFILIQIIMLTLFYLLEHLSAKDIKELDKHELNLP